MAENAYSCKTNFIILPLHRPPRFAFRLVPSPLYLFHCSSAFHAHNESPTASLFPVRFVQRWSAANIIDKSRPENARRSVFKYSYSFAFLHAFPLPSSPVFPFFRRLSANESRYLHPPPSLSFSSTIYIYIFIRDKFHSNLIQRNPIHFPFLSRNHAIYFYATIPFNLSKFDLGLSLSRFFERYIPNINNEKYNERPGNYVTTIRPVFLDSFGELILPFPPPSTMPSLEITLSTIRL